MIKNKLRQSYEFESIEPEECLQSRPFINGAGVGVNVLMIMSQHSDLTVTICIKPIQSDVHVSGSIKREGAWELETVNNVIRAMQSFPDATFLGEYKAVMRRFLLISSLRHRGQPRDVRRGGGRHEQTSGGCGR